MSQYEEEKNLATADPGTPAAMVDHGSQVAMADPGTPAPMEGSPPPKKILGEAHPYWGALRRHHR